MNLYEFCVDLKEIESALDGAKVFKNDNNLKPDWVQSPAENTEFLVKRDKKNILVVIGESWTYGESLPDIATGIKRYSLRSQLKHGFGLRLALALDCDLYQYAVPGNCNFYMFSEVERIVNYLKSNCNYEKIYLCIQMTEPSREFVILEKLKNTFAAEIYNMSGVSNFYEWLIRYDEIFLDYISTFKSDNVDIIVWKNFCPFQNKKDYPQLNLIKETWIQLSGKMYAQDVGNQKFQSVGWFDDFSSKYKKQIKFDFKTLEKEIDNIEKSNNFINGNYLHNNHPTLVSHILWAYKLYNEIVGKK